MQMTDTSNTTKLVHLYFSTANEIQLQLKNDFTISIYLFLCKITQKENVQLLIDMNTPNLKRVLHEKHINYENISIKRHSCFVVPQWFTVTDFRFLDCCKYLISVTTVL